MVPTNNYTLKLGIKSLMNKVLHTVLSLLNTDSMQKTICELSQHDRYQASQGICAASTYLKQQFSHLKNFSICQHDFNTYPNSWWTFAAPLSWTPLKASIEIFNSKKSICAINHHQQACSIATNSVSWDENNLINKIVIFDPIKKGHAYYKDTLVIIPKVFHGFSNICSFLEEAGAYGFLTDHFSKYIQQQNF